MWNVLEVHSRQSCDITTTQRSNALTSSAQQQSSSPMSLVHMMDESLGSDSDAGDDVDGLGDPLVKIPVLTVKTRVSLCD